MIQSILCFYTIDFVRWSGHFEWITVCLHKAYPSIYTLMSRLRVPHKVSQNTVWSMFQGDHVDSQGPVVYCEVILSHFGLLGTFLPLWQCWDHLTTIKLPSQCILSLFLNHWVTFHSSLNFLNFKHLYQERELSKPCHKNIATVWWVFQRVMPLEVQEMYKMVTVSSE